MTPMCNASNVQVGWATAVADCDGDVEIEYWNTSGVSQGASLPAGWKPCIQGEVGPEWAPAYDNITYAASVNIDFAAEEYVEIDLTGPLTLTGSNYNVPKTIYVLLKEVGSASRVLAFPSDWKFLGSVAPTTLASNKRGVLTLHCWGTAATDVTAVWEVQP